VNTLLAKGLTIPAAQALEEYLDKNGFNLDKKDFSARYYKLGNIYMDLREYEQALASFYKAEMLDGQAPFKQEMDELIVQALERGGYSRQAQYELESRTSVGPATVNAQDKPVARIGKEQITEAQVDEAIDKLPEWMQSEFKTPEGRLRFIREYVAREVLYDKGKKLGIDKTSGVRKYVEDFRKQVVLQQLVQMEVGDDVKISPQDLELYYKANKDKYVVPSALKLSYLELKGGADKEEVIKNLKDGKGVKVEELIEEGGTVVPGIGEVAAAIENLFKDGQGAISGPVIVKDKTYFLVVDNIRPKKELKLEEVADQVESEYKTKKQEELLKLFLEKALEQQEVEIFYKPEEKKEKSS
jgi:tetratricopeptide (TPR) repeat protein